MRPWTLCTLLALAGCADPGPRDRSLRAKGTEQAATVEASAGVPGNRRTRVSVIGLVPDPLAQLYAEDTDLVIRFDDMSSLHRNAGPQLGEVQAALGLDLPGGLPAQLLRLVLRLPDSVEFDVLRPFAFVHVDGRWLGIVPTSSREEGGDRLRPLDGIYCIAGPPDLVATYEASFRAGHFLPGDMSIIAKPGAIPTLGTSLSTCFRALGIPFHKLDGLSVPRNIERIDAACRFEQSGLRLDLRLAPNRNSSTALHVDRLKPAASSAARWLPPDGTLYIESMARWRAWESLVRGLFPRWIPTPGSSEAEGLARVRSSLQALGEDAAVMLDLDPDGQGMVFLVAELEDPDATREFIGSEDFLGLMESIAGPGGHLEWRPGVFERQGISVGTVTGHISRTRLRELRSGNIFASTLSVLLRGPVVTYVAVADEKLCIIVGQRARGTAERFLDHIKQGTAVDVEMSSLFPKRIAAMSIDLAALFDGTRGAAHYWHSNGRALKQLALRWRLPASVAVTVEGGALRISARIRPRLLADAAAKIHAALSR